MSSELVDETSFELVKAKHTFALVWASFEKVKDINEIKFSQVSSIAHLIKPAIPYIAHPFSHIIDLVAIF